MRRSVALIASVAVCSALSVAVASPAAAQLGRLKKIATDAAKDAAAGKKPEAPGAAASAGGAKVDYTVTEERVTAIIAVLTPLVERAKREKERADAKAGYEAKLKPAMTCFEKLGKSGQMPDMSAAQSPAFEALTKRISVMTQRVSTLQSKGDYLGMVATQDTSAVLQMQMTASMFGAKCPAVPYKPKGVLDGEAEMMKAGATGIAPPSDNDAFTVPADKRVGMTTGQFGKIREIIAIFTMQKSGELPATAYKFTDAELAVLNGKAAQLATMAPYFKSGFLTWASWGDITAW